MPGFSERDCCEAAAAAGAWVGAVAGVSCARAGAANMKAAALARRAVLMVMGSCPLLRGPDARTEIYSPGYGLFRPPRNDLASAPVGRFFGLWSGARESKACRLSHRPAHTSGLIRRLLGLAYELTPLVFAVLAFGAGALMLVSAVTPEFDDRLRKLTGVVSPILVDLSHFVGSIAGFLLLMLSAGLWRRRRGAYWAALAVLGIGAVFSVLKGWTGSRRPIF